MGCAQLEAPPQLGWSGQGLQWPPSYPSHLQGYLSYIKGLPLNDMPEIFGLHDNANITFAQNETYTLLGTIIQLQPRSSSVGGLGREEVGGSRWWKGPESWAGPVSHPHPVCTPMGRNFVHVESCKD